MGGDLIFFHMADRAWPVTLFSFTGRRPVQAPTLFPFHPPEAGLGWIYSVLAGQPLPPALASRPEAVTLFSFRRPARLGGDLIFFSAGQPSRPGDLILFSPGRPDLGDDLIFI